MKSRYILAPEAAIDLLQIWRYIKKKAGVDMADRVESVIREKIVFLGAQPGRRTPAERSDRRTCEIPFGLLLSHRLSP
jgi:plasmid stabilization system protein ParE